MVLLDCSGFCEHGVSIHVHIGSSGDVGNGKEIRVVFRAVW